MLAYAVEYQLDGRDADALARRGITAWAGRLCPAEVIQGSASGPADLRVLVGDEPFLAPARMPGESPGKWHLRIGA